MLQLALYIERKYYSDKVMNQILISLICSRSNAVKCNVFSVYLTNHLDKSFKTK